MEPARIATALALAWEIARKAAEQAVSELVGPAVAQCVDLALGTIVARTLDYLRFG